MCLSQIGCPNLLALEPGLRTRFLEGARLLQSRTRRPVARSNDGGTTASRRDSLPPDPFERFLISCASFSISSAFFSSQNHLPASPLTIESPSNLKFLTHSCVSRRRKRSQ